jgi:hypothetical protein
MQRVQLEDPGINSLMTHELRRKGEAGVAQSVKRLVRSQQELRTRQG